MAEGLGNFFEYDVIDGRGGGAVHHGFSIVAGGPKIGDWASLPTMISHADEDFQV